MDDKEILKLCDKIRETAFDLHKFLRHGHLEKVYQSGLAHRLKKIGLKVIQQHPLIVKDEDQTLLGEYFADMYIEDCLILELKACRSLASEHTAQILGYMRASSMRHGLLVNVGSPKIEIKKFIL